MLLMSHTALPPPAARTPRPVRDAADGYVRAYADLDPTVATELGLATGQDKLPDLSPDGQQELDGLRRQTLAGLADHELATALAGGFADADERRCAQLLRERLEAELAVSEAGEPLRNVSISFGPHGVVRDAFLLMPAGTTDDWDVIARRMAAVPATLAGYQASLAEGVRRGLHAAPLQVQTVAGQLAEWQAAGGGKGWFADLAATADGPAMLHADLGRASAAAGAAVASLRGWLLADYLPGHRGDCRRRRRGALSRHRAQLARCRPGYRRGL